MKRVLYLTSLDPVPKPGYGGPGRVIDNLLAAFGDPSAGWTASFIARQEARRAAGESGPSLPARILPERFLRPARRLLWRRRGEAFIDAFAGRLREREAEIGAADIVHAHDIYAAAALRRLGGEAGSKPLCVTVHAPGSTAAESAFRSPDFVATGHIDWIREKEAEALARADCVVAPSRWALKALREEYGDFRRSAVLYNGIAPSCPRRSGRFRAELGIRDNACLAVSLGRLVPEKGFEVFIRAFKKALVPSGADLYGVIAGAGPESAYLAGEIEKEGLSSSFKLLGHRTDAAEILADADIYVSSSFSAAFDLGLLEAMRAGLPVLAADIGGNPEALGEAGAGILFPAGDSAAAGKGLAAMAADALRRASAGKKAREYFEANYSLKTMRDRAAEIYRGVLSGHGGEDGPQT